MEQVKKRPEREIFQNFQNNVFLMLEIFVTPKI